MAKIIAEAYDGGRVTTKIMTPPYASVESAATFSTEKQPTEIDFDQLHRYIVIALGFCEQPIMADRLRTLLSPDTEQALNRQMTALDFIGKTYAGGAVYKTGAYIDYFFGKFSGVVAYNKGYFLSPGGQAQCTDYLEAHVSGDYRLDELPIMVQQLAEPSTIGVYEQNRIIPEAQSSVSSVADSLGVIASATVRAA